MNKYLLIMLMVIGSVAFVLVLGSQLQKCTGENCEFIYTKNTACAACDESDEGYKCVSPLFAKFVEKRHDLIYSGKMMCGACAPSPFIYRCDNGEKTNSCNTDADCYTDRFKSAYLCLENKCTFGGWNG